VSAQTPDPYSLPARDIPSPEELEPPVADPQARPGEWRELYNWGPPVECGGSVELGINGAEGNQESLSFRAGAELQRKSERRTITANLQYAKTSAHSMETQHYGQFTTKWERLFGESPWTCFVNSYFLYDEFRPFDIRLALHGGVGYRFFHTDRTTLTGRFGSGASREIGGLDDSYVPEAVFGADFEQQIGKKHKLKFQGDYFPAWEGFEDYRLVVDASWELLLDEEANLSLKFAANDRYDSTPDGLKPNDINYSLLLIWKL
jgi:putative salt-induced outer membrane protein YdiY